MGLDALPLLRGAGVLGASLLVTCVTRGFGPGNRSASGESPSQPSGDVAPQRRGGARGRWWEMGGSLAVAAALSAEPSDSASCAERPDLAAVLSPGGSSYGATQGA